MVAIGSRYIVDVSEQLLRDGWSSMTGSTYAAGWPWQRIAQHCSFVDDIKKDWIAAMGGGRRGHSGYAGQHPDKVRKLVLLAPAYNRGTAAAPLPRITAR